MQRWLPCLAIAAAAACNRTPAPSRAERPTAPLVTPGDDPPVPLNANSPAVYPAALLRAGIEGTVLIRMFVDSTGKVEADSTRIAESSGFPALDSAALSAAPKLRFAPAMHENHPAAAPFLQPFTFRNPARTRITP